MQVQYFINKEHSMTKKTSQKSVQQKDALFFEYLAAYGNVTLAAQQAGHSRSSLYHRRAEDASFAAAWDAACAVGTEALEDEARRRAYEGWEEPVWHKGEVCGTVRKFSDTLLLNLLKAHKPEQYQERKKVDAVSSDGSMTPVNAIDLGRRTTEELMALCRELRKGNE